MGESCNESQGDWFWSASKPKGPAFILGRWRIRKKGHSIERARVGHLQLPSHLCCCEALTQRPGSSFIRVVASPLTKALSFRCRLIPNFQRSCSGHGRLSGDQTGTGRRCCSLDVIKVSFRSVDIVIYPPFPWVVFPLSFPSFHGVTRSSPPWKYQCRYCSPPYVLGKSSFPLI